ncbi:MAG: DUF58 domain-containing protein [Bdellovibrionales bacterium]
MTFSEFREYIPGDDIRDISWSLTARTGKVHIKKYDEERELTTVIVVDVSGSGDFGSGKYCKGEVIVHLAALLGFSANKNNDRVGLLTFSDRMEHYVPPKKGVAHMHRILRDLLYEKPKSNKTDLLSAISHLSSALKKQANIFILSDFIAPENYEKALKQLGKKHDVTAILVRDDKEMEFPKLGGIEILDPESGETIVLDSSSNMFQGNYKAEMRKESEARLSLLRKSEVRLVEIPANRDYVDPLIAYFKKRHK